MSDEKTLSVTDVEVSNHGSIWLFRAQTDEAEAWMRDHTDGHWLGRSLAVEHRYGPSFAQALEDDGGFKLGGR